MEGKNGGTLKPFEKGKSGNPAGKPVGTKNGSTVVSKWFAVNQKLKNPLTGKEEKMSQEDLCTLAIIKRAREGNVMAYKELMDRAYGAALQKLEQTILEQPLFPDVSENNSGK
jgi:hypothetical protein